MAMSEISRPIPLSRHPSLQVVRAAMANRKTAAELAPEPIVYAKALGGRMLFVVQNHEDGVTRDPSFEDKMRDAITDGSADGIAAVFRPMLPERRLSSVANYWRRAQEYGERLGIEAEPDPIVIRDNGRVDNVDANPSRREIGFAARPIAALVLGRTPDLDKSALFAFDANGHASALGPEVPMAGRRMGRFIRSDIS
jgi:hypothetical protein